MFWEKEKPFTFLKVEIDQLSPNYAESLLKNPLLPTLKFMLAPSPYLTHTFGVNRVICLRGIGLWGS